MSLRIKMILPILKGEPSNGSPKGLGMLHFCSFYGQMSIHSVIHHQRALVIILMPSEIT
jgi:hypothetical protein